MFGEQFKIYFLDFIIKNLNNICFIPWFRMIILISWTRCACWERSSIFQPEKKCAYLLDYCGSITRACVKPVSHDSNRCLASEKQAKNHESPIIIPIHDSYTL